MWMMDDMERAFADERAMKTLKTEKEITFVNMPFFYVLYFFLGVFVLYIITTLIKTSAATNKAEYWQYYGYSRLTAAQKILTGVVSIGLVVFFIFHYVYYYEDIIMLYFCLLLVGRPLVLAAGYVFMLVVDYLQIKHLKDEPDVQLSLGQKKYLTNPALNTEEYILLDIYELLVGGYLHITAEPKDPAYPNRYRNYISINMEKERVPLSSFQELILDIFPTNRDQYYQVHRLIARAMEEVGNFKCYRKDHLILDLVKQNIYDRQHWIYHSFKLTSKGTALRNVLNMQISKAKHHVDAY